MYFDYSDKGGTTRGKKGIPRYWNAEGTLRKGGEIVALHFQKGDQPVLLKGGGKRWV